MVLESLFNPFALKKKLWHVFIAGFFYSVLGILLAFFVFKDVADLLMVFLIVLAALPIFYTTIKKEEELELQYKSESKLLKEHTKVLIFFMFLFLGIVAGLVTGYVFFPQSVVDSAFSIQQDAIVNVNNYIQENITGNVTKISLFVKILLNNLKVLFFCLIFSFLYGTGAIFILTWNASVIATAMGSLIKTKLAALSSSAGFVSLSAYFGVTAFSFFRYMTHGFFEIMAYFIAGLAGGIISIALVKKNLTKERILIDTVDLLLISIGLLIVASVVEVYITPILFL